MILPLICLKGINMDTTVTLQPPFEYYWWLILVGIVFLAGAIVLFLMAINRLSATRQPKKKKTAPVIKRPDQRNLTMIKDKYTKQIQALLTSYQRKQITKRDGYQRLSLLIRGFVTDATGINVENYTKTEIKGFNIKSLDSLMDEYYIPEFGEKERSRNREFGVSCNKTIKVIKTWK